MNQKTLPDIIPIRPVAGREPFGDEQWSFEFKYDGFRGFLYIGKGEPHFISRQKKTLSQFETLAKRIASELSRRTRNAIFDGELVTKDQEGRPIFGDILYRRGTASYVAFDLLWLNDEDLRKLPLSERRKRLKSILPKRSMLIEQSLSVDGKLGKKLFELMCENDLEGVVAKRLTDAYAARTRWYKIKNLAYSQSVGRKDFFDSVRKRTVK